MGSQPPREPRAPNWFEVKVQFLFDVIKTGARELCNPDGGPRSHKLIIVLKIAPKLPLKIPHPRQPYLRLTEGLLYSLSHSKRKVHNLKVLYFDKRRGWLSDLTEGMIGILTTMQFYEEIGFKFV